MADSSNSRTSRSSEDRESTQRVESWTDARKLPTPTPVKGMDFQYVRQSTRGSDDNINYSQALRNGWEPVPRSDVPELMLTSDQGSDTENCVFGGMILCRRPSHIGIARQKRADEEQQAQLRAIDQNYMRDNSSAVPKFADHRRTTFGDE